jgi:hypothetical protein
MVTEDNNRVIHVRSSEIGCHREKEDNHEQHPENSRQSNRTALLMNKE